MDGELNIQASVDFLACHEVLPVSDDEELYQPGSLFKRQHENQVEMMANTHAVLSMPKKKLKQKMLNTSESDQKPSTKSHKGVSTLQMVESVLANECNSGGDERIHQGTWNVLCEEQGEPSIHNRECAVEDNEGIYTGERWYMD